MLNHRKLKTTHLGLRVSDQNKVNMPGPVGKRQGEAIQKADPSQKRRAAFGDLTNAFHESKIIEKAGLDKNLKKSKLPTKPTDLKVASPKKKATRRKKNANGDVLTSQELVSSSQESLSSSQESLTSSQSTQITTISSQLTDEDIDIELEDDFEDIDKENMHDPTQVAEYAPFIFQYYKERELEFMLKPYMSNQSSLTANMRSILVDWLVEIQENFELNHETLYLAVKLVDFYLSHHKVGKEQLQLVGAASLFISCKFDERLPPLVEDFLFICDDAYKRKQFLEMERHILKTVGFDIGIPLSYRFLRRYAKCAKANMETLTLARYILEMSLMEYDLITEKESQVASAALLLAFKMSSCGSWSRTLVHYTGYREEELSSILKHLNNMLSSPPNKQLNTIKSKYSHKVFYEVAKVRPLKAEALA